MSKAFDVAVIGAGAIGTSTAYHLSEKGYRVVLMERGDIASGSSSHCDAAALLIDKQPGLDTHMGMASIQLFHELNEKFDYEFDLNPKGSIFVCETDIEYHVAKTEFVDLWQSDGYDITMVDNKTLCELEPHLAKDMAGGIWSPDGITLTPYKLCFAFVEEAKKLGMEVRSYCKIQSITAQEGGFCIATDGGELLAEKVVNCAGCWAPEVGALSGLEIPIQPRKGMNLITEKCPQLSYHKVLEFGYMLSKFDTVDYKRNVSPIVEEYNVAFNIEYTEACNMLIGGYRGFRGFDIRSEVEAMKAIAERSLRFYPELRDINCIRSYAGVRPFVKDHLPIVSEVDTLPGYYIAAGHEGDGICFSPITGKLMSQLISGEETIFDISRLSFSRFSANKGVE